MRCRLLGTIARRQGHVDRYIIRLQGSVELRHRTAEVADVDEVAGPKKRRVTKGAMKTNKSSSQPTRRTNPPSGISFSQDALGSEGKHRQAETSMHGHLFTNTIANDHARIHMGDVFNFSGKDSREGEILYWLTGEEPSDSHNQAFMQYRESTLEWFFEDDRYRTWRDSLRRPRALWCQGNMGTGKTTLVAQVAERLSAGGTPQSNVAVVYCRLSEQSHQSAENILGLILAQLYDRKDQGVVLPPYIKAAFDKASLLSMFRRKRPTPSQLEDWLVSRLLAAKSPSYILMDALDELHDKSYQRLLKVLGSLPLKGCAFGLLVTSRYSPEHNIGVYDSHTMEIRAKVKDLQTLVSSTLSEASDRRFQQLLAKPARSACFASIREEISHQVVIAAQNMCVFIWSDVFHFMALTRIHRFLHAALHLDQVLQCRTPDDVYSQLYHFPEDLGSIYDRAWERTSGKESLPSSQCARLLLMWVVHVGRPFTVAMLEELFARSNALARYALHIDEDLLSSCAGLIFAKPSSADPKLVFITMVHPSAYRYLDKRKSSYFPHAEDMIASACLSVSSADDIAVALPGYLAMAIEYVLSIFLLQHDN
jgi:Cdc6-like AAA superfamily ATPase